LGTGTPSPDLRRRGPSQIIEAGSDLILVDCGAGTLHRLVEAGYDRLNISRIAFTHLHSDHITGVLDVLWAGWIQRRWQTPPVIVGPPGTQGFIDGLMQAMSYDIRVRTGEVLDKQRLVPQVEEIEEGWSVDGPDWRLEAFRVEHEPVDQSFGFRLDQGASSIVISGDTKWSDNLIKHSNGAGLLVHEVYWEQGLRAIAEAQTTPEEKARFELVAGYHTPSTHVGKIAEQSNAGHLILSHIIRGRGNPDDFAVDIKPDYRGQLTVGEDLMTFEV
jgi:ribonuclease Z